MNTKTHSPARDLVLAALFLALAFVLPMITGHVPQIGNMLCPMHFPVLLAGFVLGGPWGLALGFAAPLLRSVLFISAKEINTSRAATKSSTMVMLPMFLLVFLLFIVLLIIL